MPIRQHFLAVPTASILNQQLLSHTLAPQCVYLTRPPILKAVRALPHSPFPVRKSHPALLIYCLTAPRQIPTLASQAPNTIQSP
jgi:hypothetical protein